MQLYVCFCSSPTLQQTAQCLIKHSISGRRYLQLLLTPSSKCYVGYTCKYDKDKMSFKMSCWDIIPASIVIMVVVGWGGVKADFYSMIFSVSILHNNVKGNDSDCLQEIFRRFTITSISKTDMQKLLAQKRFLNES